MCISSEAQVSIFQSKEIKKPGKNSIYLEILGNGVVYSINYDRIIPLSQGNLMFLRVGGNEYHSQTTTEPEYNFLGAVGMLLGKGKHYFEPSLGYTHFSGSRDRLFIISGGYRRQGYRGLVLRLTPMIVANRVTGDSFHGLWFGVSLGFSF